LVGVGEDKQGVDMKQLSDILSEAELKELLRRWDETEPAPDGYEPPDDYEPPSAGDKPINAP